MIPDMRLIIDILKTLPFVAGNLTRCEEMSKAYVKDRSDAFNWLQACLTRYLRSDFCYERYARLTRSRANQQEVEFCEYIIKHFLKIPSLDKMAVESLKSLFPSGGYSNPHRYKIFECISVVRLLANRITVA